MLWKKREAFPPACIVDCRRIVLMNFFFISVYCVEMIRIIDNKNGSVVGIENKCLNFIVCT